MEELEYEIRNYINKLMKEEYPRTLITDFPYLFDENGNINKDLFDNNNNFNKDFLIKFFIVNNSDKYCLIKELRKEIEDLKLIYAIPDNYNQFNTKI